MRYYIRYNDRGDIASFIECEGYVPTRTEVSFDEYNRLRVQRGLIPVEPPVEPLTADEERDLMLVDLEYRTILLELGL